jgi:hypothetical protein
MLASSVMLGLRRRRSLLLALGLTLAASRGSAAAFEYNDAGWEGTAALLELARSKLGKHRVAIDATIAWDELDPADGLLILHPTAQIEFAQASAFLRAGGRIAVLDDYGSGTALFERFRIRRIRAPLKPSRMLRDNPNLAIALPAVQLVAGQEQGRHPVVAGVEQLVTNHPTSLTHPDLTPVLTIPAVDEPNAALAVTGIIAGRGRLFVMGDPSTLINQMLRYPGNRAFAIGLIEYLVEDDAWGRRGGTLHLVANTFRQRGHFGGAASLLQDARDLAQAIKELVAEVRTEGLPDLAALALAALAAFGAVAWAATNATRPYRRTPPRYCRPLPLVAQGGAAGRAAVLAAPTTQRSLAALELKNALEEGLANRLGVDVDVGPTRIVEEIVRQEALSGGSLQTLRKLFGELRRIENAVAAGQPIQLRVRHIERWQQDVQKILTEVAARSGVSP